MRDTDCLLHSAFPLALIDRYIWLCLVCLFGMCAYVWLVCCMFVLKMVCGYVWSESERYVWSETGL